MVGATDALQERRDGARRAQLTDQIDGADVDAQLQRSGGDDGFQLAAPRSLLDSLTHPRDKLPW